MESVWLHGEPALLSLDADERYSRNIMISSVEEERVFFVSVFIRLSDKDGKVYISGKNIYISKAAKDAIIAIFISEERKKVIDDNAVGWVL